MNTEVGDLAGEAHLVCDNDHRHPGLGERRITGSTSPTNSGSSAEVGSSKSISLGWRRGRARSRPAAAGRPRAGRVVRVPLEQPTPRSAVAVPASPRLIPAGAHRACDVVERRQVVKEVEMLEHHPDVAAQLQRAARFSLSPGRPGPNSTPSTSTDPWFGSSSRLIVRSRVDLPEAGRPEDNDALAPPAPRGRRRAARVMPERLAEPAESTTARRLAGSARTPVPASPVPHRARLGVEERCSHSGRNVPHREHRACRRCQATSVQVGAGAGGTAPGYRPASVTTSKPERAYDAVRRRIVDGTYRPGDRIVLPGSVPSWT